MTREGYWIIRASLIITAFCVIFFVLAPAVLSYPMSYAQATRVLQIIVPVFVGYLAIAARSEQLRAALETEAPPTLTLLSRGPIYVFSLGMVALAAGFWYSNRPGGLPGSGMTIDQLCWFITALMGLLSATTAVILGKAFAPTVGA